MAASRGDVMLRSLEPLSPFVTTTSATSLPSLTSLATVPPAPNSQSSGCAVITSTRRMGSLMSLDWDARAQHTDSPSPACDNPAADGSGPRTANRGGPPRHAPRGASAGDALAGVAG